MPPILHLVRHAQAQHNINTKNHNLLDPPLTTLGEAQCRALATSFPHSEQIDFIVASPLKRTIQTALIAFANSLNAKILKVICLPALQETSDLPCDTGSSKEDLEREFAGQPVDFSHLSAGWEGKEGLWAPDARAIEARTRAVRCWLRDREEGNVVVVTHGGFLHYFIEDWSEHDRVSGTGWRNTEWRSVRFIPVASRGAGIRIANDDRDDAHVVELPESQERRKRAGLVNAMKGSNCGRSRETERST